METGEAEEEKKDDRREAHTGGGVSLSLSLSTRQRKERHWDDWALGNLALGRLAQEWVPLIGQSRVGKKLAGGTTSWRKSRLR